jgi:hypothetical protein
MTLLTRFAVAMIFAGSFSLAVVAQQTENPSSSIPATTSTTSTPAVQPPVTTQAPQQPVTKAPTSAEVLKQSEKQRALGVVPLFGMTNVHDAPPMTSHEKFQLMVRTMIDPFTFVSAGLTAGLGQATNSFDGYGQGAAGFGKRYGAALADNADSNFFSNYFYPVIFKQDPRYFRLGEGTFKKRAFKAIEQEFVARKDSGGHTFHYSNVLGAITAGTISNTYYPNDDRGVGLTAGRAATSLGYGCLGNLFLEFWPDIDHKLFHKHESQADPSEPPGTSPK